MDFNKENLTVAEVVTHNIKAGDVFQKNGIDFCCGGNVALKAICEKNKISFDTVVQDLEVALNEVSTAHNYDSWDLDFLSEYIINTHHKYVQEATVALIQYSDKVARVHGDNHPEVVEINKDFHALAQELEMHMHKEEMILFPFIKQLANAKKNNLTLAQPHFGTIQNPINMMEAEHDGAGDIIKNIKSLTNDFTPPEGACNTFKLLYSKLEEFQNDLFQHIHLENNILFPKAIRMEKELFA